MDAPLWKIVGHGDFELIAANAAHITTAPGRKTDMNDAMWIADLQACGVIKASPTEEMQERRSPPRSRRHAQRVQKRLAETNIRSLTSCGRAGLVSLR